MHRLKRLLSSRVVKIERAVKNLDKRGIKVKESLDKPAGNLYSVEDNHLNYDHELAFSLSQICSSMSAAMKRQRQSSKQTIVNLAALYAITDSILFYMTTSFDLSTIFDFRQSLFATVRKQVFSNTK